MTNRDKINKMTDKELANALYRIDAFSLQDFMKQGKSPSKLDIENWLSQEVELTADEMFEELGYKKQYEGLGVQYGKKEHGQDIAIEIHTDKRFSKYFNSYDVKDIAFITYEEDKAIHKKIEEIKN